MEHHCHVLSAEVTLQCGGKGPLASGLVAGAEGAEPTADVGCGHGELHSGDLRVFRSCNAPERHGVQRGVSQGKLMTSQGSSSYLRQRANRGQETRVVSLCVREGGVMDLRRLQEMHQVEVVRRPVREVQRGA